MSDDSKKPAANDTLADGRLPSSAMRSYALLTPHLKELYMGFYKATYGKSKIDLKTKEYIAIAASLRERGCDVIHVKAGQTIHDDRPEYRRGFLTALSDRVRNEGRVPTLVGGHLTTLDEANTIVAAGRADLVLLDLPEPQVERASEASDTVLRTGVRA